MNITGSVELNNYLKKYNIPLDLKLQSLLNGYNRKSWQRYISTEQEHFITEQAIDLLESMLRIDHMERITAREALAHRYFSSLKRRGPSRSSASSSYQTYIAEETR